MEHEHKWITMTPGEYICNVTGCGIRCDAAPAAELEAARAERGRYHGEELYNMISGFEGASDASVTVVLRRLLDELTRLRGFKGAGAESLTNLAARVAEELGARPEIDIAFVYVSSRTDGFGAGSCAPGIPVEIVACQVMESLVTARKAAHEQQRGQRG